MKIKTGDNVIVTTGADKGKQGKVVKAFPREEKVLIEGVNVKKVHQKPRGDKKGQTIERAYPIHVSNVMIADPKTQAATRIGITVDAKGKRVRVAKKSGVTLA